MSKYSSFKEHQLITENWRKFTNEASDREPVPGLRGASFDTSMGSEEYAPDSPPSTGSLAGRLWDVLGMVGSLAAFLVTGPGPGRKHGDSLSGDDHAEFQEHRNPAPLTEGEGPPKAFEQWSQMFPKAGEALMSVLEALMGEEIPGVVKHDRTQAEIDQGRADQAQAAAERGPHPGTRYEEE
jgi:hypothetical protein